jgi:hypothetical protein
MNDDLLKELLREWRAPEAPTYLETKLFAARKPWWQWLLTGSIRIPVPAMLLALIVLAAIFFVIRRPEPAGGLADFQAVKQLNPRVIRSNYEAR